MFLPLWKIFENELLLTGNIRIEPKGLEEADEWTHSHCRVQGSFVNWF